MNNSQLQSVIALNAKVITNIDIQIGFHKDQAMMFKDKGEKAFSVASYKKVAKERAKLAKATLLQRQLLAEYKYNQRMEQSIKVAQELNVNIADLGIDLTSYEIANMLAARILAARQAQALQHVA